MNREPLPIDALLTDIVAQLLRHGNLVLRAPTGAGKTTRVPSALLDGGLAAKGRIVVLEPRRLAARAAAARMAYERGSAVGEEIGYHVRFDRKFSPATRILVVTEGILLRMMQDDPFLENVAIVVLDEFHERSLDCDLAIGMLRLLQQTVRNDLHLVIMSATLAAENVARFLGDCPVLTSEGRLHSVTIQYRPRPTSVPWPVAAAQATEDMLERTDGDLLVFLPGLQEIRHTAHHLERIAAEGNMLVLALHGDLPLGQQDAALQPQSQRRIVLATNVAETSVTVEGISGVVDTGLVRLQMFDAHTGLDRLRLMPISRSSADQRAGRAGRTRPGTCIRLWSEAAHRLKPQETEPEIRRVDLAGAVLHLLSLGETDLGKFPWFEPPQEASLQQARLLLERLDALENGMLTPLGATLARLPLHPRLGRMLLEAHRLGCLDQAALAAALLTERDPFRTSMDRPAVRSRAASRSDVLDRVEEIERFRGANSGAAGSLNRAAVHFVLRSRDQLLRSVRQELGPSATSDSEEGLLRALLAAFPDRLVRRRGPGSRQGLMVGGRGVRLAPQSSVMDTELFLAIDLDAGSAEALVRQASVVERAWLEEDKLRTRIDVEFDEDLEKVVARRRVRFEDLVLEEGTASFASEEEVARVLADAAGRHIERVLPEPDSPAGNFRTRVRCLRGWMPELDLPAFEQKDVMDLLTFLCAGRRSFAEIKNADWLSALRGKLTHAQWQAIEREAPERLQVPSGSRIAVRYDEGRPPVLAVRIQEIFGWRDTPRIAGGRVRVLLHLLAPNQRPQQVTEDLASFWSNTYPLIRKELRARYPKHAWPENPLEAVPRRRPS